jgi:putative peptide zinc metalloprotease protein
VNTSPLPENKERTAGKNTDLEKMVPSRLRADLIIQKQYFKNEEYFVIKDPLALTYFRLRPEDTFIISLLDGKKNLKAVAEEYYQQYPNSTHKLEDIGSFIQQLGIGGLLNINARRFVDYARNKPQRANSMIKLWMMSMQKLIFLKVPLIDPSPWLGKLTAKMTFVWSRWFVGSCLAFFAWTIFWLIVNHKAFAHNDINFLSPANLILMWLSIIFVKTCHEFGHATTCRHFGSEVHEMGVCLICFTPCGYVDASDAYMMKHKRHKIYTTLAGVFTEFIIASLCAHVWLYLSPGLFKNIAFNIMFVASINTIFFNMNPLMRFDGYYVISDLADIPNLRTKSINYCSYRIQQFLFGIRNTFQERLFDIHTNGPFFIIYAISAFLYMGFIIYSLSQIFAHVLAPYGLGEFGLGLGVFAQISFIGFPIAKVLSDAFNPEASSHIIKVESTKNRLIFIGVSTLIIILVTAFLPSRYNIDRQGIVLYSQSEIIATRTGGLVQEIFVKTGDWVEEGEIVARLKNPSLESDLAIAQADFDLAKLSYGALQNESSWETARHMATAAAALEVAETHYRRVLEEANNLELKAPIAGYVLTPDVHQLTGKYIVPRQAIMRVGRRDSLRLILPLTETEVQLIELGSEVKGRWKSNAQKFETVIDVFPSQKASNTDYLDAMFTEFGGPAPREKMEQQNQFPNEPQFSLFLAEAPLTNQVMNHQVFEGMRVQATILGKKTTVGKKIWRNVVSFWDNNMRSLR